MIGDMNIAGKSVSSNHRGGTPQVPQYSLFSSTSCTGWYDTISPFGTSTLLFAVTFPKEQGARKCPKSSTGSYAGAMRLELNADTIAKHQRLMSLGFHPFLHYS